LSLALVFERLARAAEFSKNAKLLRIGGIGSMVYSALTITPMHDLMVTISLLFFLVAVLTLLRGLHFGGERRFFVAGSVCLGLFIASGTIYYSGRYGFVLPWAQRVTYGLFALWLVALDGVFPR
jgi:hypothetical protein